MTDEMRWPKAGWVVPNQRLTKEELQTLEDAGMLRKGSVRKVTVDTTSLKECTKCHRSNVPVYRHHMGNDGFLAIFNKDLARTYHQFLDCTPLCGDCHCEIHFIYDGYLENWLNRTPRGAKVFRKALIGVCKDWLAGKIKSPTIPEPFKREFKGSLKKWQKKRSRGK